MRAAQQAAGDAERRFPVRVRIAVPPEGFGSRLDQIIAWLDANCGFDRSISRRSSFVFRETAHSASTRGNVIEREIASFGNLWLIYRYLLQLMRASTC
jgi:hypothetical protein